MSAMYALNTLLVLEQLDYFLVLDTKINSKWNNDLSFKRKKKKKKAQKYWKKTCEFFIFIFLLL